MEEGLATFKMVIGGYCFHWVPLVSLHPVFLLFPCPEFLAFSRSTIWKGWVSGSGAGVPGPRRDHTARRWSGSNAARTPPFPICCSSCEISRSPWLTFDSIKKFIGVFLKGWISQLVVKSMVFLVGEGVSELLNGHNLKFQIEVSSDGISKKRVRKWIKQEKMFVMFKKQIWNERNSKKGWNKGETSRRDRDIHTHTHTQQDRTKQEEASYELCQTFPSQKIHHNTQFFIEYSNSVSWRKHLLVKYHGFRKGCVYVCVRVHYIWCVSINSRQSGTDVLFQYTPEPLQHALCCWRLSRTPSRPFCSDVSSPRLALASSLNIKSASQRHV